MASSTTVRSHGNDVDIPWVNAIAGAIGFGFIGVVIYAVSQQRSWLVFACALLIGLAASVAGGLAGFIFGIPKTSPPPRARPPPRPPSTPATPTSSRSPTG